MNLSRAYRPALFSEISGQTAITEVLRKEVEQNKLGHAYLFSGPRGIGKTTAARIFAKAVNCLEPKKGEPCLKCRGCGKAAAGSLDIIEMDAASHTGVDNIREAIVEHVRFVPAELKYKVYIVDEAHMLSASAWNALLKTIEEPPEHAIFIFATTERQKVPVTIVSRCQRFEFRRIAAAEIVARLKELASKERFKVHGPVFDAIASRAEGCLRDAENLLGQLFSLGEKDITQEVASLVIPPSRLPLAAELLTLASKRDTADVLAKIDDLEQEGTAFLPLFDDLISAVRFLMLSHGAERKRTPDADWDGTKDLAHLAAAFGQDELLNISLMLMERRKDAKQGLDPRFALEMAMLAIAIGATGDNNQRPFDSAPLGRELGAERQGRQMTNDSRLQHTSTAAGSRPEAGQKSFDKQKPMQSPTPDTDAAKSASTVSEISKTSTTASTKNLSDIIKLWPQLLQAMESNKSLLFILKLCRPISIEGSALMVQFQYPYHQHTIVQNIKNKMLVENILRELSGIHDLSVQGEVKTEMEPESATESAPDSPRDTVSSLLNAFGGRVVS